MRCCRVCAKCEAAVWREVEERTKLEAQVRTQKQVVAEAQNDVELLDGEIEKLTAENERLRGAADDVSCFATALLVKYGQHIGVLDYAAVKARLDVLDTVLLEAALPDAGSEKGEE